MVFIGSVKMIDPTGLGMVAKSVKLVGYFLLCSILCLDGVGATTPTLAIWDDAIIDNPYDLTKSEVARFIYSNEKLNPGDKLTVMVPMGPGYRVLCCIAVAATSPVGVSDLQNKYPYSISFMRRLQSLKGVRYIYSAIFVPEKEMNSAMRRVARGSGETYYSAPALLGVAREHDFNEDSFNWSDWGRVTLTFKSNNRRIEQYKLNASGKTSIIQVEALPD